MTPHCTSSYVFSYHLASAHCLYSPLNVQEAETYWGATTSSSGKLGVKQNEAEDCMPHISYQTSYTFISRWCLHIRTKGICLKSHLFLWYWCFGLWQLEAKALAAAQTCHFSQLHRNDCFCSSWTFVFQWLSFSTNASFSTINRLIFIWLLRKAIKETLWRMLKYYGAKGLNLLEIC